MTTEQTEVTIVTRNGQRFAEVPLAEYHRLKRLDELPPLPEADEHGNRPAVEYATVSLARKIINGRHAAGLTQVELARLAGVRPETIHRLESAKNVPSIATIDKIDRALKTAEAETAAKPKRKPAGKKSAGKRK